MSSSTERKMKRKLEKCINAATDYFCEAMASGQGLELKKALLDVPSPTVSKEIPLELKHLVEAFENAPSFQVKLIILTLVPKCFSKKDVCEYFGVTKYVIERARKIRSDFVAGATPPVKTITASDFHCLKLNKTSERRQMSGIDNYTADGLEGFKLLGKLIGSVHALPERKAHFRNLKKASLLYLKGDFWSHVVKLQSNCSTHCRQFAPSNEKVPDLTENCGHERNETCPDCENIFQCLDDFHATICDSTVSENEKEEKFYDLQCATTYILEWMRHILRAAHTHQTKVQALESLDDRPAYCMGDWIMKIIPSTFVKKWKIGLESGEYLVT